MLTHIHAVQSYHVCGQAPLPLVVHGVGVVRAVSLAQHPGIQQTIQLRHSGAKMEVPLICCV